MFECCRRGGKEGKRGGDRELGGEEEGLVWQGVGSCGSEMGGRREVRFVRLAAPEGGVWAGGRVCVRVSGCVCVCVCRRWHVFKLGGKIGEEEGGSVGVMS